METRTNLNEKTIEGLHDLVRINIDSEKGFKKVAELVDEPSVATLFRDCAFEREKFAADLIMNLSLNREDVSDAGSVKGKFHRWWIDVREKVSTSETLALLQEAERGEDEIKERYEEVIKETTGNPLNDVLHSQYAQVKKRHDQIRDLRDARS